MFQEVIQDATVICESQFLEDLKRECLEDESKRTLIDLEDLMKVEFDEKRKRVKRKSSPMVIRKSF